jgi:hypothetical protein
MHAVVRTCAATDASKNRKPDNKPITALFASHFRDALSQAKLLWDLICTRQGSNLQPYDPKSYTLMFNNVRENALFCLIKLDEWPIGEVRNADNAEQ